uniref:C-type lectin domain-containing protein n=1 Tax=Astyanax mexicanus TaxID=7994 RepID=A0A8B9H6I3_ASTMX
MDEKWISVIWLFSAVCGVSPYVPHRYHFVNQSKTWTEAQSYCRQTYTDLATINNMDEMKKLNETLKGKGGDFVWIGLNRGNTRKWGWSLGGGSFYSFGDSYRNWDSREPNNAGGNEYCGAMYRDSGQWLDHSCGTLNAFVCFNEKNTSTETYVLINERKTWREAQSYCREHYTDLTSVRNQTENQEVRSVAKNVGDMIWFGLFNDPWKWSEDQNNSSFRYWSPNQADNTDKCAAASVKDQSQWYDVNCNTSFPFICYENELVLIQKKLSWAEALRYCRENHVDLVSVHSEEIQLWVKDVAQKASTDHVWLGLRHTCTQGFWFWTSGFTVCYQNWAPGNGAEGEDCSPVERTGAVQARGDQQWVSLPENQTLNFICISYEG